MNASSAKFGKQRPEILASVPASASTGSHRTSSTTASAPAAPSSGAGKTAAIADAVREGLSNIPRSLPPWLFYDARGSALFEEITQLPEYYLTRAEREILETHAGSIVDIMAEDSDRPLKVVELGAGSAAKTQLLLRAVVARQGFCEYLPIDVSSSALDEAVARIEREEPGVSIRPIAGTHLSALPRIRESGPRRLVLFLGSSIGNYADDDAVELLSAVGRSLLPGAGLLLGTDRKKDPKVLLPAYDDAAGVTADFNLNLLMRLNRELGADFQLIDWRHEARWNEGASCIEMHLVSKVGQTVRIPGIAEFSFAEGESIHTESSAKYDRRRVDLLLEAAGFHRMCTFTDDLERFDLHLARL